ncbi:uncharacterized protein TNCV_1598181 [Trichonephila clavipes]|nr:uncharacterized protein TNCV_1598181 [Trichonephila clavipes]
MQRGLMLVKHVETKTSCWCGVEIRRENASSGVVLAITMIQNNEDIALSDYHLFHMLKRFLGGKRFGNDEELETAMTIWFNALTAEEYNMEIMKLLNKYDKSYIVGNDCVEK